jgi:hypothetical protein
LVRRGFFYKACRALDLLIEILIEAPSLKALRLMRGALPARVDVKEVHLLAGAELVRPVLSKEDQLLLDDHRQCGHFLVQGAEGGYSYVVTVKRKMNFGGRSLVNFMVSDILHLSSCEPALEHWQFLCQLIATHDCSQAVVADIRFFELQRPNGLYLPFDSYFMSKSGVSPKQIDGLYTEVALLDEVFSVSSRATSRTPVS